MKITEIPEELLPYVRFACKVCRNKFKSEKGKNINCAWRGCSGEVCDYIEQAIKQTINEINLGFDSCVACGGYTNDGHLCINCKRKIGG